MTTDLNSLMIFARVVESNSFSQAARRLRVPISTVSRRVAELEKQLGVRLIERSTRHLRLTAVGSEVLEQAQRSSAIIDAVADIASNHTRSIAGTVRISVPPTMLDSLLVPVICRFQQQYPDARVQVFVTDRMVNQIDEGVDLAFRTGPLEDSSLVVRHVLSYRHRLLVSPAYAVSRELPCHPKELLQHRLIAFSGWTSQNTWSFTRVDGVAAEFVDFEPQLSINQYSELALLLLSGAGIGDLPPTVYAHWVREGRLVEVMPLWRFQPVDVSIVHLGNCQVNRAVRLFKEMAVEQLPQLFSELTAP